MRIPIDKRLLELAVFQILLFAFIHLGRIIFAENRSLKISIFLFVIGCVTYFHAKYLFRNRDKIEKAFLTLLMLTTVLFELTNIIAYYLGFLPRFSDSPFLISFSFSATSIALYLLVLIVFNRLSFAKKIY